MRLQNCFIVIGESYPPQVHLLDAIARKLFDDRMRVAAGSEKGVRAACAAQFGAGAEIALPAWSMECMSDVAQHYDGPHATQLKGICAAIALGRPYGPKGHDGNDGGGVKVPVDASPKPKRPSPARVLQAVRS